MKKRIIILAAVILIGCAIGAILARGFLGLV